jgi:flagellar motility protein MotE (MotC chaperone)
MSEAKKELPNGSGTQGSDRQKKAGSVTQGILAVVLALLLVAVVFSGAFYFVLKNDVYGLGEQFRPQFEKNPILRLALPPLPPEEDPDDPKRLTQKELLEKYDEYRGELAIVKQQLEEAKKEISDLTAERAILEVLKRDIEMAKSEQVANITETEAQIAANEALLKELSSLIASGDTTGFKAYFEKVDPITAKLVYEKVLLEESASQDAKQIAKPFEIMEPDSAAEIMTLLWAKDKLLLLDIVEAMKTQIAAEVLQSMDATTAADITKQLSDRKKARAAANAAASVDLTAANTASTVTANP